MINKFSIALNSCNNIRKKEKEIEREREKERTVININTYFNNINNIRNQY